MEPRVKKPKRTFSSVEKGHIIESADSDNTASDSKVSEEAALHYTDANGIPSLVFSIFVENTLDVTLLKICRLVCKSWNAVASYALRSKSCIFINEANQERLDKFKRFLTNRAFCPWDWASPFQNLHVVAGPLRNETLKAIIHMPDVIITALEIGDTKDYEGFDQKAFLDILVAKGAQISELKMYLQDNDECDTSLFEEDGQPVQLPVFQKLKLFSLEDYFDGSGEWFKFFETIIGHLHLEAVDLDPELLNPDFITTFNFHTVKSLKLFVGSASAEIWDMIARQEMPALKELKLESRRQDSSLDAKAFSVIRSVSLTIETLSLDFFDMEVADTIPACPKLRRISFEFIHNEIFKGFTPASLPSLEEVSIIWVNGWKNLTDDFVEHGGVKKVNVSFELHSGSNHCDVFTFLTHLRRRFPNIEDLNLRGDSLDCTTLPTIQKVFPDLKGLGLGISTFCDLPDRLRNLGDAGKKCWDSISPRCSIFDFSALESISLGYGVVTYDAVTRYLPKIATLKRVEFDWRAGVSPQEIRDCLGHLEKITILDRRLSWPELWEEFDQLYTLLPNVCFKRDN